MTIASDKRGPVISGPELSQSEIVVLKTKLRQQNQKQAQLERAEDERIHEQNQQTEMREELSRSIATNEKKILPAFLLCLFFGSFAVHKFYAGRFVDGTLLLGIMLGGLFLLFKSGQYPDDPGVAGIFGFVALIAFFIVSITVLVDFILIIAGAWKDGSGNKITEWT